MPRLGAELVHIRQGECACTDRANADAQPSKPTSENRSSFMSKPTKVPQTDEASRIPRQIPDEASRIPRQIRMKYVSRLCSNTLGDQHWWWQL